ncbi:MAG: TerD family protein [Oscillospiraceae bacterium]|nr:TerD family protein [Oscillospiraceae bacterium]
MAVELRKGQKVNLSKNTGKPLGEILINLNWSQPPAKKILGLTLPQQSIDLDLGCLYEMKNGKKGCVQALGNAFGNLQGFPYIALDGDDRSGASSDGENLRVNGARISEFKRILIYTFIYEGAANWKFADGVVTVKCPDSQDLIVRMDEYGSALRMCAIAMLENSNNETFSVEKLVQFYEGHQKMDRAFNWGMNWVAGRKD